MRTFSADDYFKASKERLEDANQAHLHNRWVAAHFFAGLSVECMLRAYKLRVSQQFDSRHDLSKIGEEYYKRMTETKEDLAWKALLSLGVDLWLSNDRYCDEARLRERFTRQNRYQRSKGNMLENNARAMIDLATPIVVAGIKQWK